MIMLIYVLSKIYATFEAQFMKKLGKSEAKLKKDVSYKKYV